MSPSGKALLVLSGGIGSGKSTVGRLLADRGITVIDADEVAHLVLEPGEAAFGDVSKRWPEVVTDGAIDRSALGRTVFGDQSQLRELEQITHPAIRTEITRRIAASDAEIVVVEVPLLSDFFGDGWRRIVVDALDDLRRQRLMGRGMTEVDIEQRMSVQPSRREWLEAADLVVANSGSLDDLELAVQRLVDEIQRRGANA